MSSPDPERAAVTGFPIPPEPQGSTASAGSASLPTNTKEEMDPQALSLLREFFLLLDAWDRQHDG